MKNQTPSNVKPLDRFIHGAEVTRPGWYPFRITAEINRQTFEVTEYTYYTHYANASNYTSEPLKEISEAELNAAYKIIAQQVKETRQYIAKGKKHPAYKAMLQIVKATVQHYHDDFYYYDLRTMGSVPNQTRFIWVVRNTGTWLIRLDQDTQWATSIIHSKGELEDFYLWNGKELRRIHQAEAINLIH